MLNFLILVIIIIINDCSKVCDHLIVICTDNSTALDVSSVIERPSLRHHLTVQFIRFQMMKRFGS